MPRGNCQYRMHHTRRAFLRGVAASGLGLPLLAAATRRAQAAERKPNIIFILADDLGWAELGAYGNTFNETPNLDRLAREGMRFTDAYAAAPVCSPMRASFMTGQYPARVGITDYLRPNDPKFLHTDHVAIAEALAAAGYATGLVGKWHLMGDYRTRRGAPTLHGFAEVICSEESGIGGGSYFHPYRFMPRVKPRRQGEYLTDRLNQEAIDFIARHAHEPFFLYVSHYAVHTRLAGRPSLVEKYRAKPGAATRRNNPVLAAMVESIDEGVGAILGKLDALGIADHTIVIFNSDNGGEHHVTSNAPLRGAKSQLYEGGIREPLIIRWPGLATPGSTCPVPVSSVDFYPTLLDAAGTRPDPRQTLDGASLLPLLRGEPKLPRDALFWHYPLARRHFLGGRSAGAIRKGNLKLIEFFDTGTVELYDLAADLGETHNLAPERPAQVAELRGLLAGWRKSVGAVIPKPPPPKTGLQLHLPLDDPPEAAAIRDRSPHARHLACHGTACVPVGKSRARRFNGTTDFLDLDRRNAPDPSRMPITVAAWICPAKPDGVVLAHGGDRNGYALYLHHGRLAFAACIDWKRTVVGVLRKLPDGWVHVAAQLAGDGGVTLFVNGRAAAVGRAAGLLAANPGDSLQVGADAVKPVGQYTAPNRFAGLMAGLRVAYGPLAGGALATWAKAAPGS